MILRFFNAIKRLEICQGDEIRSMQADCVVRNELNGWRPNPLKKPGKEVVYGITQNPYQRPPVMPREFPKGKWEVYSPVPRNDKYLAPYYIPTNAEQYLETWDLAEDGGYGTPNGGKVLDIGYGLHCSTSGSTVGCIKIYRESDLLWLVGVLIAEFCLDKKVWLEV